MTNTDIHTQNNHMKGTVFDCEPSSPDSPIQRGIITIDGSTLRVAVYAPKTSRNGNTFYPIRLQYTDDCRTILKSVPVSGVVEAKVI